MGDFNIKKVCNFNISSIHFSMMILPYINKELEKEKNIISILENDLEKDIKNVLSKITTSNEAKEKILNINWKNTDIRKSEFEENLKNEITKEKNNLDIIIYGDEKYINLVNSYIQKNITEIEKHKNKINIKILNCYTIDKIKGNIKEILNQHDLMFNTSGEYKVEDSLGKFNFA